MVTKTAHKKTLQLAAPPVLIDAVKSAADRELLTISEYIRRTLVARLLADGVRLTRQGALPVQENVPSALT